MNENTISPDDPRLTAYALDEMKPAERAEFEKLLQADPAARQAVEEIRATGALLTGALAAEPMPAESGIAKVAILPGGDLRKHDGGGTLAEKLNRPVRFPHVYYYVSGLAAACFALFFVYWQRSHEPSRQYVEMDLAKAGQTGIGENAETARVKPKEVAVTLAQQAAAVPAIREETVALTALTANRPAPATVASSTRNDSKDGNDAATARQVLRPDRQTSGTEAYGFHKDNAFLRVGDQPVSTFPIDVDTASYANVRRFLNQGRLPPADAVRIEELVNYFPYHYAPPAGPAPFAAHLEVASAPWAPQHRLVRIGLKGREVGDAARPAVNLVFLVDVSGSMNEPDKLPLVKQSLRLLVDRLRTDDRVAIAVYAGASGLVLPSTPCSRKAEILDAIDRLEAGGPTNGTEGIPLAYDIAKANFMPGGVNRVILATDSDFNAGAAGHGELVHLIEEKAKNGVFLSVLAFGMRNYKDGTLEQLAARGNGNYACIDSAAQARKVLVEQAGGTLGTIAKDVRIQVEFNPAQVQAYRLIGYENRLLAKEEFNDDRADAGEIGAGHTVTALYEVVPVGTGMPAVAPVSDALKYQRPAVPANGGSGELLTVKVRYKEPAGVVSQKLEFPLHDSGARFEDASEDFKFAAAVAAFGMALRDSPHKGSLTLADISAWGRAGMGSDAGGDRREFLGLVATARQLLQ
jgi:Ca-activated chloride channel family protein